MAQVTKLTLLAENAQLKEQNAQLWEKLLLMQRELDTLRQPKTAVPSAPTSGRVAITADNPLFAGLARYQPHSQITCPTHRESQANKVGVCARCALARVRGERAAA